MPTDLGAIEAESQALHNADAWVYAIEVDVGASDVLYITSDNASFTHDGKTYEPFPIAVPQFPQSNDVAASTVRFAVPDVDFAITRRVAAGDLEGQEVRVKVLHRDNLTETAKIQFQGKILRTFRDFTRGAVLIEVGASTWIQRVIGRRFARLRCGHEYGNLGTCGYDTTRAGALATCDLTKDGTNGCSVHGADELANGLAPLHPRRFGGFPGIQRQNRG